MYDGLKTETRFQASYYSVFQARRFSFMMTAFMMDEIDIGEIEDDEARAAARARRKALNKRCALASSGDVEVDGDLAAKSLELKKAVMAARAAMN